MKTLQILFFIAIWFISISCKPSEKEKIQKIQEERKQWALQYREKIYTEFKGFSNVEILIKEFINFISNQNQKYKFEDFFLSEKEFLEVYWANRPWNYIYDPGMTLENAKYVYFFFLKMRWNQYSKNYKNKNISIIEYKIKSTSSEGPNQIINLESITIKQNQSLESINWIGSILCHNQLCKILTLKEQD